MSDHSCAVSDQPGGLETYGTKSRVTYCSGLRAISCLWLAAAIELAFGCMSAQAVITPVARPDPHGSVLEPLPPGPTRAKFEAALAYLRQVPQAAQIIKRLQNSSAEYKIEIVDRERHPWSSVDSDEFEGLANLVHWDPELAFEWRSGFHLSHAHSAAISLMHELGHAYHKEVDPTEFFRLVGQPVSDPRWTNLEEKRTILEIENPVAVALGESQRFFHADSGFHDAELYAAVTPTSTQAAHQNGRFMPLGVTAGTMSEPAQPRFPALPLSTARETDPQPSQLVSMLLDHPATPPQPQFTPVLISGAPASEPHQPEFMPLLLVACSASFAPPQFMPLVVSTATATEAQQSEFTRLLLAARAVSLSPAQFMPLVVSATIASEAPQALFTPLLLTPRPVSSSPPQFTPLALPVPRPGKPLRPEFRPLPLARH